MHNLVPYRNGRRFGTLLWDPMRLFDDLMARQPAGSEVVWSPYRPPVGVAQTDDGATVTVDVPGVDPEDLDLTFERGTLTIAAKRGADLQRYSVVLGDAIDPAAIEARLDKGVLVVHARMRPEAKPRKIAVASGEKQLASGETK
jgi:HSP20 family protein